MREQRSKLQNNKIHLFKLTQTPLITYFTVTLHAFVKYIFSIIHSVSVDFVNFKFVFDLFELTNNLLLITDQDNNFIRTSL